MRHPANILIGLILTSSFAFSQDLYQDLDKAYRKKSIDMADRFFTDWREQSEPVHISDLNDTLAQVYSLFDSFFNPLKLSDLGADIKFDSVYLDSKYFIVDNQINVYVNDKVFHPVRELDSLKRVEAKRLLKSDSTDREKVQKLVDTFFPIDYGYNRYGSINSVLIDSIIDFRPYTSLSDNELLYLDNDYKKAIQLFLGADKYLLDNNHFQQTLSNRQIKKRLNFLKPNVTIRKGWHFDFHYLGYPEPFTIVFDKDFKYARIDYWISEKTGFAIFERVDNDWRLIFGILTRTI
jgi:hypothetical protein